MLAVACGRPMSSCCGHRGCVLLVVGWRCESSVSVSFYTHAHPLKKNIVPIIRVVVVMRRFVTYGIRAGSTCDLGFATASVT
jgi:hypothetical protein